MQRLGDPTAESVGRPSPMGEIQRDLSRLNSTALDFAEAEPEHCARQKQKRSEFSVRMERSSKHIAYRSFRRSYP
jgi:hypothetical protein